jgi:hypothetical protein
LGVIVLQNKQRLDGLLQEQLDKGNAVVLLKREDDTLDPNIDGITLVQNRFSLWIRVEASE